jgi:formylglycine-generating enzyme required for sulfatase activity
MVEVSAFEIAKRPVTLAEFLQFSTQTGYLTTAERSGATESYRTFCAGEMPEEERLGTSASLLSWFDAEAFCRWAHARLPTEHEWLAAAILDWDIVVPDDDENSRASSRVASHDQAMEWFGLEWTSSCAASGLRIMRSTPTLVLRRPAAAEYPPYVVERDFYCHTSVVRPCRL